MLFSRIVVLRNFLPRPPQASEELAAGIAGATLELIEGAGHLLPFEHPRRLAATLAGLVSRAA